MNPWYHPISALPLSSLAADTPSSNSTTSSITTPASSTYDVLDLHPAPDVPSTFLPSYYPDSRHSEIPLPSSATRLSNNRQSPTNAAERIITGGPASRHLLDGVALSSPPRAPRTIAPTPTYELSPGTYTRLLPPVPQTWVPKHKVEWNESPLPLEDSGGGGGVGGPGSVASGSGSLSGSADARRINMSETPYPFHHTQSTLPSSFSPSMSHTDSHYATSSPHINQPSLSSPSRIRPPNVNTNSNSNPFPDVFPAPPTRTYSTTSSAFSDPAPTSLNYPGVLFNTVSLPDSALNPPGWYDSKPPSREDYAKVLQIYEHLSSAIPHIQPVTAGGVGTKGQEYETLLRLAQQGANIISGQSHALPRESNNVDKPKSNHFTAVPSVTVSGTTHSKRAEGKGKPATKCLGCGATETPEWRRGPMGPRTLCNACGLVHMKLQRKKKKLEEKAAAAAAAAKNGN